jgi:hypothetical protein
MAAATVLLVAAVAVGARASLQTLVLPNERLLLDAQPSLRDAFRDRLATALPGAVVRRRRRRLDDGAGRSRRRLRIFLDARALYESPGSHPNPGTCFRAGDPFSLGVPPPGGQLCGEGVYTHCTGTCRDADVVTPSRAAAYEQLARRVIVEDFDFLDLPTPAKEAPLVLAPSTGIHSSYYRAHGIADEVACARDCALLAGWTPPPALCDGGLNQTDVVIALLATPQIPGVAASAGPCAYDPNSGRPLVALVRWHQALPTPDVPLETLVAQHAGLLTHELFHGLGFLLSSFRSKNLVAPRLFADADGEVELAWAFHPTTAVAEAARQHFGCNASELWFPLMVNPDLGAHNHFPTRRARPATLLVRPCHRTQP